MKVYRTALLGCGRIGSTFADDREALGIYSHAEAYATHPQTSLAAVCDADAPRRDACADRWKVPARFATPEELFAKAAPEIVSICTPDDTHFSLAMMALAAPATRAILLEKPLALRLEDARTLLAEASQRGVPVVVNYSRRYAASHATLRTAIQQGALGRIQSAAGYYTKGIVHNGTHWIDLARFLLGDIARVQGFATSEASAEDPTLDARLEFVSGATAYLHGCDEKAFTLFEMDVVGTNGRVRLVQSGHEFESFTVADSARYSGYRELQRTVTFSGGLRDVTLHAVEDVVACVESPGRQPICSAADALAALEIACAVRKSAELGEAISLAA